MADGFPILSAGSCSCSVTCGGPTPPKYFRAIYRWDRSNLRPWIGHASNKAGRVLTTSTTRFQTLVECQSTATVTGNARWNGVYCYQVRCRDFIQATYIEETFNIQGSYLRATNTSTSATLDFNIGLWKTNNPAGVTTDITLNAGLWYNNWTTGNIAEFINVANCATFETKSNSFLSNPCNSTSSYIGCCAYCDLSECNNCGGDFPGSGTFGLVCSCYGNDDDCCYTFGPGGVTGRTVAFYSGLTGSWGMAYTYHKLFGNSSGSNVSLEIATYDRDPNTAGAQKLYYFDPVSLSGGLIYDPTNFGYLKFQVSAINGNMRLIEAGE